MSEDLPDFGTVRNWWYQLSDEFKEIVYELFPDAEIDRDSEDPGGSIAWVRRQIILYRIKDYEVEIKLKLIEGL